MQASEEQFVWKSNWPKIEEQEEKKNQQFRKLSNKWNNMLTKTIKKPARLKKLWNFKNAVLDFEEADKNFEKSKYCCFKIFDLCLVSFIKNT